MLWSSKNEKKMLEISAKLAALNRSQAVIEFAMDGTILTANENFLKAMGYSLEEVQGKHHSMFVEPSYKESEEYKQFWRDLNKGEYRSAQYKRLAKGGVEVWIEASYNPIMDLNGKPYKVVKYATVITQQKKQFADYDGQIKAINKSQAVIEFAMDGTILNANENFLGAVGYGIEEVRGKHHSMFVAPSYRESREYKQFWQDLNRGMYQSGQYKRLGKGGVEVWIEASYNPIMDLNGKPYKVVKYATVITQQKKQFADYDGQIKAINKVQGVIHFETNGIIIEANDLFLNLMGYTLDEIKGKHHRVFVEPVDAQSSEYTEFWKALAGGTFQSRVFKRITKNRREVWIQASYNPIFDAEGRVFKIVKYATDITDMISLTEATSQNVQSVAAATEEMSASISQINNNIILSKEATKDIAEKAHNSAAAADSLVETMKSMQGIVSFIRTIAEQVNLLALNATIEAARAGDAGKGFAVVAAEVKNLANQTSKATDEIAEQIGKVEKVSTDVANSIKQTVDSASHVDEYVTSVSASIQEQSAVTKEISENSQKTAVAVSDMMGRIKKTS